MVIEDVENVVLPGKHVNMGLVIWTLLPTS